MFASRLARASVSAGRQYTSGAAIGSFLQKNVWGKSNVAYVSYVIIGAIVCEAVYGNVTDSIWESSNQGVR